jgi:protein O-GlcNAc transferase
MQFGLTASLFDAASAHQRAGRFAEAERLLRQALQFSPNDTDSLHLLGVLAGQAGRNEASLALFDQALALRPDFAHAHSNRAVALLALGREDEAIEALNTAVELKPDLAHGLYVLGNTLAAKDDLVGAESAYRRALEADPTSFAARNNLGSVLQRQGRLE